MLEQGNRTFIGSVCFVDIVGYSKQSVSEQILLKDRFTSLLSDSLKDVAPDQRIILDTGDGAALSFLGDPEDALFVSMNMRDFLTRAAVERAEAVSANAQGGDVQLVNELSLRIGVNLGPVKLIRDINGQPNIVGDGINVAQRIMSFAHPGQIVVSRSYYDVVSVISDEYAKLFKYEGSRTDKHVREHEIYIVGESAAAFNQAKAGMVDRAASTNTKVRAGGLGVSNGTYPLKGQDAPAADAAATSGGLLALLQDHKKLTMVGGALAVVVLALLFALIVKKPGDRPAMAATAAATKVAPVETATAPPAAAQVPSGAAEPAAVDATSPDNPAAAVDDKAAKAEQSRIDAAKVEAAKAEAARLAALQGVVNFSVQPWGNVFINGKSIGASPPLKQTRLAPGKYKIEIKNTTFAPFVANIEIKSKEELGIKHKFQ